MVDLSRAQGLRLHFNGTRHTSHDDDDDDDDDDLIIIFKIKTRKMLLSIHFKKSQLTFFLKLNVLTLNH